MAPAVLHGQGSASAVAQTRVRDSAGVRIVETTAADAPVWTVRATPELTIGAVDGPPQYEFSGIVTAIRLADGRIVIADGASREIRFFGTDGRHQMSVGRRGNGPGEFPVLRRVIRMPGDSILVFDDRRITMITPAGTIASTVLASRFTGMGRGNEPVADLGGGRFAMTRRIPYPFPYEGPPAIKRESTLVMITGMGAAKADTVTQLADREMYIFPSGMAYAHPFEYSAAVAGWNGHVVTGTGEGYELRVFDSTNRLRSIIRRVDAPRAPLTSGRLDQFFAAVAKIDGARSAERYRAENAERFPGRRFIPSFRGMRADSEGYLWVQDFPSPDPPRASRAFEWTVFAPDGSVAARVTTPPGFTPFSITDQHIVGLKRDSLNVEYVRLHRLERRR